MTHAPSASEIVPLHQSLVLGLKKRPVALPQTVASSVTSAGDSGPPPGIVALVLAGQYSRFQRIATPPPSQAQADDAALHDDARPMLSEASRRALKLYVTTVKGGLSEAFFIAAWDRIAAKGLRLHPFDLPELAAPIKAAETYAPKGRCPGGANPNRAASVSDPEAWRQLPKTERIATLRELRRTAPDSARELLASGFKAEPSALRVEFLAVLTAGLTAEDIPFLEEAAQDRAESVRAAAEGVLGWLPGTAAYEKRLDIVAARLTMKPEGKKSSKPGKFVLQRDPKTPGMYSGNWDVFHTFNGLAVADIARRMRMTAEACLEALSDTEDSLILGLLATAARQGDRATALSLVNHLGGPKSLPLKVMLERTAFDIPQDCQEALTTALTGLALNKGYPDGEVIHALYAQSGGPLPDDLASGLLASAAWREHLATVAAAEAPLPAHAVSETALLMPDSLLDAYNASIAPLSPHLTVKARAFTAFGKSLTGTTPVAPLTQSR